MREIKFRAWDNNRKEMFYDCLNSMGNPDRRIGKTFMQYTGLQDKNGKEIYEGDTVRVQSQYETDEPIDSAPNKIYFSDGAFRCGFHNMVIGEKVCTGCEGNWNMEVIGNIYEE